MNEQRLEETIRRSITQALQHSEQLPPLWQVSLQQVAASAAEKAVIEGWARLGVDMDEALEWRNDLHYVRQLRQGAEFVRRRVLAGVCSLLLASALWMVWEGVCTMLPR